MIPKLGLREYWYPALRVSDVGTRRPKKLRLLGTDLAFFRGKDGQVVALNDVCPHRGARLSEGHCHFAGTVSCPYHGWTFDENGKNVAILSEGPDSRICGKPGTEARKYPTQQHKGIVFIWMGDGEPAPIEDDVPEEFFRDDVHVLNNTEYWHANWEVALENSMDAHVPYLHINAWWVMLGVGFMSFGAVGGDAPVWTGNGFSGERTFRENVANFPGLGKWPKTSYRKLWNWAFNWYLPMTRKTRQIQFSPRWEWGHHLPGMFRTGLVFDYMTRWCVPVDENTTRLWYFHAAPGKTAKQRLLHSLEYKAYVRFLHDVQFSKQDEEPMLHQRYDTPEMLSLTDLEVVHWRRLVVTKHLAGRNAPFQYRGKSMVGKEGLVDNAVQVTPEEDAADLYQRPKVTEGYVAGG
jgi:phenylpropionate dioxygenase-like ring-hydroxylating dioxygenase large terminal subunit